MNVLKEIEGEHSQAQTLRILWLIGDDSAKIQLCK